MCGFAFHQAFGRITATIDEPSDRLLSAFFQDPDQAGRAYDMVVELGYANEEIRVVTSGFPRGATGSAASTSGGRDEGIVLAVEPRTEEDARLLASRWQACGSPDVGRI
jgi:hypothetical protein